MTHSMLAIIASLVLGEKCDFSRSTLAINSERYHRNALGKDERIKHSFTLLSNQSHSLREASNT